MTQLDEQIKDLQKQMEVLEKQKTLEKLKLEVEREKYKQSKEGKDEAKNTAEGWWIVGITFGFFAILITIIAVLA